LAVFFSCYSLPAYAGSARVSTGKRRATGFPGNDNAWLRLDIARHATHLNRQTLRRRMAGLYHEGASISVVPCDGIKFRARYPEDLTIQTPLLTLYLIRSEGY
jgi:hypothetical protein